MHCVLSSQHQSAFKYETTVALITTLKCLTHEFTLSVDHEAHEVFKSCAAVASTAQEMA